MKILARIPALIMTTTLMLVQSSSVMGLSSEKVATIAQQITVRIDGTQEGSGGSGVIVDRDKNVYTVLTNCHVIYDLENPTPIDTTKTYTIVTPNDNRRYTIRVSQKNCHPRGLDLAIVKFSSTQDYQVASLSNSQQLAQGQSIFVYGWEKRGRFTGKNPRVASFRSGNIIRIDQGAREGMEVVHNATYNPGMSGGPLLDAQGKLAAINSVYTERPHTGLKESLAIPVYFYQRQSIKAVDQDDFEDTNDGLLIFPIKSNGRIGYIDADCNQVIAPMYNEVGEWEESLVRVKIDGKWGYINPDGKLTIVAQFQEADDFSEGLARVKINGKWGFINSEGKQVIFPQFQEAGNFSKGLARVKINGKWGFINSEGVFMIAPTLERAGDFQLGFAEVKVKGKWGFINPQGEQVIQAVFDELLNFSGGLSAFKLDGKWGYINPQGKIIIPATFDQVGDFREGLARVKVSGKWGYINPEGKQVIFPQFQDADNFHQGLARVKVEGKWGYINPEGKQVIFPQFDELGQFKNGFAWVKFNGKTQYINREGIFVFRCDFEFVKNLPELFNS